MKSFTVIFFFFNDTATTEIYTLSLHDALPIYKDVYEHTLIVVTNAMRLEGDTAPDFTLRMAALMHDVGKPATKAVGRDGRVSFHHHEVVGARLTKQRMKAMRSEERRVGKECRSRW